MNFSTIHLIEGTYLGCISTPPSLPPYQEMRERAHTREQKTRYLKNTLGIPVLGVAKLDRPLPLLLDPSVRDLVIMLDTESSSLLLVRLS